MRYEATQEARHHNYGEKNVRKQGKMARTPTVSTDWDQLSTDSSNSSAVTRKSQLPIQIVPPSVVIPAMGGVPVINPPSIMGSENPQVNMVGAGTPSIAPSVPLGDARGCYGPDDPNGTHVFCVAHANDDCGKPGSGTITPIAATTPLFRTSGRLAAI